MTLVLIAGILVGCTTWSVSIDDLEETVIEDKTSSLLAEYRQRVAADRDAAGGIARTLGVPPAWLTENKATPRPELEQAVRARAEDLTRQQRQGMKEFYGLSFGVGPSIKFGGPSAVESASLVGPDGAKVVRVTEEHSAEPAILFETHYFFTPFEEDGDFNKKARFGIGPFMAMQFAGDSEVIDGIGAGLMLGWRYDSEASRSFNIGFGGFLDANVKQLGPGVVDGQPLPPGETEIRFIETDEWRWIVTFSFSFDF
jgi:hypothetical protein